MEGPDGPRKALRMADMVTLRFMTEEALTSFSGDYEVHKVPAGTILRCLKEIGNDGYIMEREIEKGDVLHFYEGWNKLILKTHEGMESVLSLQKEFLTLDGYMGTIYLTGGHSDMNLILKKVDAAPCQEKNDEQVGLAWRSEKTGIQATIEKFMDEAK